MHNVIECIFLILVFRSRKKHLALFLQKLYNIENWNFFFKSFKILHCVYLKYNSLTKFEYQKIVEKNKASIDPKFFYGKKALKVSILTIVKNNNDFPMFINVFKNYINITSTPLNPLTFGWVVINVHNFFYLNKLWELVKLLS